MSRAWWATLLVATVFGAAIVTTVPETYAPAAPLVLIYLALGLGISGTIDIWTHRGGGGPPTPRNP
jgi:hypothetical protein